MIELIDRKEMPQDLVLFLGVDKFIYKNEDGSITMKYMLPRHDDLALDMTLDEYESLSKMSWFEMQRWFDKHREHPVYGWPEFVRYSSIMED